ncbi:nuclear transport factor 2 family protein [Chelativorans sp. YIM 93263]|uniref:nuclear transport factor 2 family protein n=1 Tax=Chelativorans sp. YIM 93263 TaxID=2906648 RepID=UPI0023791E58|nr:nuclear transport factor 2 family protein [Chelativorans sp. YIM 93263]
MNLSKRSTAEVLEDHLQCRMAGRIEDDIERNFAPDVVLMTAKGMRKGHDAVRSFNRMLREHVPDEYIFPLKLVDGPFAFIEWRAREPGRSVEDGADSFVIENGRIIFQSIHYSLQETMPG